MLVDEFFAQLGPEFTKYIRKFKENGFDFDNVATITSMIIPDDLDTLYSRRTQEKN